MAFRVGAEQTEAQNTKGFATGRAVADPAPYTQSAASEPLQLIGEGSPVKEAAGPSCAARTVPFSVTFHQADEVEPGRTAEFWGMQNRFFRRARKRTRSHFFLFDVYIPYLSHEN